MNNEIRVLVVDDSTLAREMISHGLNKDPDIVVVATAEDPYEARDLIITKKPDVLTLDVEMPKMNGVEFLKRFMPQYPLPVVMVSAYTEKGAEITLEALDSGAVDFVTKPKSGSTGVDRMINELKTKIKIASTANVSHWRKKKNIKRKFESSISNYNKENCIIAIGASTGGTEAVSNLLAEFPDDMPGIIIVQHMPGGFTKTYADRLNDLSNLNVKEAENGDIVEQGKAYVAKGGFQIKLKKINDKNIIVIEESEPQRLHNPSIDVLFNSLAEVVNKDSIGIILTGMGSDGAEGLLNMKRSGARTYAQDEESSVIYGMPKVAYEIGAANKRLHLNEIPDEIFKILNK
ncbi:MAG: chemotaxis response regulator protein-glutamate methylesterase [Desulfobacterales bacterium]|nr:chemotaxis response regulator protein-glutamate methylesterase [Desulfobacterales bacterium]MCP4160147.1 chemotaxis response regulator protein-glutamate methylesterase [Deltaproteobacteria bacterium]